LASVVFVPALVSSTEPKRESFIPSLLRAQKHPPRLPTAIAESGFTRFWEGGPVAANPIGRVASLRYWAVRGRTGYLCLVGTDGVGTVGTCSPAKGLAAGVITSGTRRGNGEELIGLVRDGYTSVYAQGKWKSVTRNVFRLSLAKTGTGFRLSGRGIKTLTIR
jgi:hypothetical protein